MKKSMTHFTLWILSILMATIIGQAIPWRTIRATAAAEPSLSFVAINPGYTEDGVANTGEVIVLRQSGGNEFLLTGLKIRYMNSAGNFSILLEFPEGMVMTGEEMQLRLATDKNDADLRYAKTIAMSAGLELLRGDEVIDKICWTGEDGCEKKFTSTKPTTLVKDETGKWEHRKDCTVEYGKGITCPEPETVETEESGDGGFGAGEVATACAGLEFSEILTYYESEKSEQFMEFYNHSAEQMVVDGCRIKYKNKEYAIGGVVAPSGYLVVYPLDLGFSLTKNPTSENTIELVDANGEIVDTLIYYNGQKKGVAWAQFGYNGEGQEQWLATYLPTPGQENDYQKFKTCAGGKVINEQTGNCVKDSTLDTTLEACPEGKYRNPLTGRCKSYETDDSELKECAEGYERNPETNRCRKIKTNTGAEYPLEAESYQEETNFVAIGAVVVVVGVGLGYVVWQFRKEIWAVGKKVLRKKK